MHFCSAVAVLCTVCSCKKKYFVLCTPHTPHTHVDDADDNDEVQWDGMRMETKKTQTRRWYSEDDLANRNIPLHTCMYRITNAHTTNSTTYYEREKDKENKKKTTKKWTRRSREKNEVRHGNAISQIKSKCKRKNEKSKEMAKWYEKERWNEMTASTQRRRKVAHAQCHTSRIKVVRTHETDYYCKR